MNYLRERGINFSQVKYKLLDKTIFKPYIRSNGHSSIPYSIIDHFKIKNPEVIFIKTYDSEDNSFNFRIKKLYYNGNSHIITLKSEKKIKNPEIEVLDIKSEKSLLLRKKSGLLKFIPKFTKKKTPIYIFDYGNSYLVGGYYKKDIFINKNILNDKLLYSFLGLYLAEGGKTAASFTNSWPEAINIILDFIENNFNIKREDISASICCNSSLKSKKRKLENFWKDKTGISKFFRSLHINKNVKSPQGILELYFNSEILKELFLNLIKKLNFSNDLNFINGFLSGDGSPILQNKYCITHHVVFNPKDKIFNNLKYSNLFINYKFNFINKNRLVVYSNWDQNLFLLNKGIYSLSPMKRFRFFKSFLSLSKTKTNKSNEVKKLFEEYKKIKENLNKFYSSLVEYGIYNKKEMEEFVLKNLK
ncbi:MAG: hypothetical protein KJ674_00885 [Nanoarchaeota archaeon]|nr:hypothetical protein [Nanoarchaeota archaeon]